MLTLLVNSNLSKFRFDIMLRFVNILLLVWSIPYGVSAQYDNSSRANIFFLEGSYSAAQSLYHEMISNNTADEAVYYYNAKCSEKLFSEDAIPLYEQFLLDFPFSSFCNKVYKDLAFLKMRNSEYNKALNYFYQVRSYDQYPYLIFNIAYSYFCLDSLSQAQYYFSKLINIESKYSAASQYYFSHIAYKNGLYKTALEGFMKLVSDDKFGSIVPYYIAQIYFFQKNYNQLIAFVYPILESIIPSRKLELKRLLAESYYRTKQYKEAIVFFNHFIDGKDELDANTYFLLGHSYFLDKQYAEAVKFLEMVNSSADSTMQYSSYILASSYLHLEQFHYALQAFKKSSSFSYDLNIQEEAFYNYAKLSYQLEMPFDNTFLIFKEYLENHFTYKQEIEDLVLKTLQSSSKYKEALGALQKIDNLTADQELAFQKLAFFIGVKEYNKDNFRGAIHYFDLSNNYVLDDEIAFLSVFWLADSYYQLNDYESSIKLYNSLPIKNIAGSLYYSNLKEYNLAYAYFQKGDYKVANKYFRNYEQVVSDSMRLQDTYLRIADCFFMSNQYSLSEIYYQKAVACSLFDLDYAIYKRSQSLRLIGNYPSMIKLLLILSTDFVSSPYYDDALNDLAEYYKYQSSDDLAMTYYDKLLAETNEEKFIANAFLSKGIIYFKSNRVYDAINEFLYIVNNFQQTIYFKEALSGLQAAYISLAKIDEYLKLIDELPQISITQSEQDSLIYNTAFIKFSELEYKTASIAFEKYIEKFEEGIFIQDAIYYNAVSLLNVFDTSGAITMYEKLVESSNLLYQQEALSFLARTYYSRRDYMTSNNYYKKIYNLNMNHSLKRESVVRLMYINEYIDSSAAFNYAKEVVSLDKKDDWLLSRAKIIIARNQFLEGNYSKSRITFSEVLKLSAHDEGAEAKYYLCYFAYLDDSLDLAENMIFELVENYDNDYFIANAFILLADIYILKANMFQAKATLESVIENCEIDEIVHLSQKKWESIVQKEINDEQQNISESYIDITDEDIDYIIEEFDMQDSVKNDIYNNDTTQLSIDSLKTIKR